MSFVGKTGCLSEKRLQEKTYDMIDNEFDFSINNINGGRELSDFYIDMNNVSNTTKSLSNVSNEINNVKIQIQSVNDNLKKIGFENMSANISELENNVDMHVKSINNMQNALDNIINSYMSTEKNILENNSNVFNSNTYAVKAVTVKNASTKSKKEEYDWDKIRELMEKDPESLTEEEVKYLAELILGLDAENIDEFVLSTLIEWQYSDICLTGSDNVFAALLIGKNELYVKLANGEISEDEYISQMMKITMIENSCKQFYINDDFLESDYKYYEDSNDVGMFDSSNPPSWVREKTEGFWIKKFHWNQTVRYMGDGATANMVIDVNYRYNLLKENSALNLLIKNTTETILLSSVSSNPVIAGATSIGYGFANDIVDSAGTSIDMSDMINSFDLHVLETESFKDDNPFWGVQTDKDYTIIPGESTQAEVNSFNDDVNAIRTDYIDSDKKVTLKGANLQEVIDIASENEFITLEVDKNSNVYVKEIQDVSVYDIMNCPNKVNELYYVVNMLK